MSSRFAEAVDRALARAAAFGVDRPGLTVWIAIVLAALSIASGFFMRFKAEVSDLMPRATAEAHRRLESVFGAGDSAFALITADRPAAEELVQTARIAKPDLEGEPRVKSVTFGWSHLAGALSSSELLGQALLFTPPAEIESLKALLAPEGIRAQVRKQALQLGLPGLGEAEDWARRDPLELRRFLIARSAPLRGGFRVLPGSLHFLSEDGRAILIRIDGRIPCSDIESVKAVVPAIESALRRAMAQVAAEAAPPLRLELALTGGYAYAREMERAVRADLTWNNTGSLLLCLALIALAYRSLTLVLPSFAALSAGMVVGFGVFSLLQREVVTLAFVSGAALAGLGIDYVMYVTLRAFADPRGATRASVIDAAVATGRPILLASVSTAAGFLTFPLAGERFLSDVGILSAVGIIACGVAAIVLLPALLVRWIRLAEERRALGAPVSMRPPMDFGASRIAALGLAWPRAALGASLLSALAGAVYLLVRPPVLEQDLRRMQPEGSESVRTQQAITEAFGGAESPVLVILESSEAAQPSGASPEAEVLEAAARLEGPLRELLRSGRIAAWSSPTFLLPSRSEQKAVTELLSSLDAGALVESFRAALDENGFDLAELGKAVETFGRALRPEGLVTPDLLRRIGLAGEVDKLMGQSGGKAYALLAVNPAEQLWRSEDQERITADLEEALRKARAQGIVTGLQILSTRQASALLEEFLRVSAAASAAVALIVVLCLRGLVGSLLALLPVALGTLWMLALTRLLGIPLNFMNVGVLPMVLGTGVDIGVHLAAQYLARPGGEVEPLVKQAAGSIMLASLTTLAAFGTMIWSASPGLTSVGAMATLGTIGCLVASLVTLPAAMVLHSRWMGRRIR